jgi:hypothetical protein
MQGLRRYRVVQRPPRAARNARDQPVGIGGLQRIQCSDKIVEAPVDELYVLVAEDHVAPACLWPHVPMPVVAVKLVAGPVVGCEELGIRGREAKAFKAFQKPVILRLIPHQRADREHEIALIPVLHICRYGCHAHSASAPEMISISSLVIAA